MRLAQRAVRELGSRLLSRAERARVARLACQDAGHGYDVFGMHRDWLMLMRGLLGPVYRDYFRVSSYGAENVPSVGAAILVANHAGTLPLDAAMICLDVYEHLEPPRVPRPILDRFVPQLPFVGPILSRLGAVSGVLANVRHLLEQGELCLIFPEGMAAIGKPWRDRYQLRDWRVGHAELALRQRVPVVPVAVIGSEEQWPQLGRIRVPNPFGIPYLPIVATPLPLPVHYRIYYGAPLMLEQYAPGGQLSVETFARAAAATREALEALIARGLAQRKGVFR
jgi:1-acyl-sn-glycerol-3-phosphate acyltransferase